MKVILQQDVRGQGKKGRMEWRSNTVFGLLRIIVKATICLL